MEFRDILAKFGRMGAGIIKREENVLREYAAQMSGPVALEPIRIPVSTVCREYSATASAWAGRRASAGYL